MTDNAKGPPQSLLRVLLAVAGGFALSFGGLGVLWIGTAWPYQALMFMPFFVFAFGLSRTGGVGENAFLMIAAGAAPIGALFTMFRDKNDSHLMPILMVCAWLAGILEGHFLGDALRRRSAK